jgi:uncharacterized protein (DUF427 family)
MPKAVFNGAVIAESAETVVVENNHYFPESSLKREFLRENAEVKTSCPWKGEASYYDVVVEGQTADYAAWFYPDPKPAASNIKGHVAFWRGVEVTD